MTFLPPGTFPAAKWSHVRGGTGSRGALYIPWGHLATLALANFPKGQLQALEEQRTGSHVHSAMYFLHDLGSQVALL